MSVESISGNAATFQAQPLNASTSSDRTGGGPSLAKDPSPAKAEISSILDPQVNDKISLSSKPLVVAKAENNSKPAGVVSHVVVSYNLKGEMRTKFEDSRNNLVYQLPSEMVAKMQDLMMTNTSTDIKG